MKFEILSDLHLEFKKRDITFQDSNLTILAGDPSHSRLRWTDALEIHRKTVTWLENSIGNSKTRKNVVISHHAPSIKSISEEDKKHFTSARYASNLEDFIRRLKLNLWIHGHVHKSNDYTIGETKVICNPLGYPDEENKNFKKRIFN